jgi:uncharacterized protein (DUF486 family)
VGAAARNDFGRDKNDSDFARQQKGNRQETQNPSGIRHKMTLPNNTDARSDIFREVSVRTIVLLTISNIFMTFAWYGHLKFKESPLWIAILASWMIAFVEYCFQVPANRIGSYQYSTAQLKTIQEVITLVVFSVFSVLYLREEFRWNYAIAFAMMVGAVFFMFKK